MDIFVTVRLAVVSVQLSTHSAFSIECSYATVVLKGKAMAPANDLEISTHLV